MKLPLYQIDAFANQPFEGNPAAICPLTTWLPDEVMQAIAMENNLSETAFFVPEGNGFRIRWFTPLCEVDLCGHATLASAYLLFNRLSCNKDVIRFESRSGVLNVSQKGDRIELDFPAQTPRACDTPEAILTAFSKTPLECVKAEDYIVIFDNEEHVKNVNPDLRALSTLDLRGVCISARSSQYDIVSRFFAPKYGIDEDPVTGSSYTQLAPYWSKQLGKTTITARQVSRRGGNVMCEMRGDRVAISGNAVIYLEGSIDIPFI
jgi:PhzF family phenazine biosynthesis protein